MRKLILLFALVLTICSSAMAENLTAESAVGTIGTIAGREAMVVDLGGPFGKVAIAMENEGATTENPYGTHFSTESGASNFYDPDEYQLIDGWRVPSKEELNALLNHLKKENTTSVAHYVYYDGLPELRFPLRTQQSYQSSYGSYVSSTTSSSDGQNKKYAYLDIKNEYNYANSTFHFTKVIQENSQLSDLAIRLFHRLVPKNQCIFYTSTGNTIVPTVTAFNVSITNINCTNGNGVITFSGELTSIDNEAFKGKIGLTSVTLPSSLKSIGESAFSDCQDLAVLSFADGSQLETIGKDAFKNTNIGTVIIPASVTSIGDGAFSSENPLTDAYMSSENLQNISKEAFAESTVIFVPLSLYETYQSHFNNKIGVSPLADWQEYTIAQIEEAAMNAASALSEADKTTIQGYIADINNANSFDAVCEIRNNALAFIDLCVAKAEAIAAINNAMKDEEGSAYLHNLVAEEIAAIKNATKKEEIIAAMNTALSKLEDVKSRYDIYKEVAEIELGSFIIKQNGPVTEVTGADGQTVKLYKMKNVKFSNVNDK